ncbi:MAG: hypothetical protein ACI82H_001451 [Alphaproteobacteria bacterium]|jgi:hypothetical protein
MVGTASPAPEWAALRRAIEGQQTRVSKKIQAYSVPIPYL